MRISKSWLANHTQEQNYSSHPMKYTNGRAPFTLKVTEVIWRAKVENGPGFLLPVGLRFRSPKVKL